MFNAPHLLIFPGVAIMITVLAFNCWATVCAMRLIRACIANLLSEVDDYGATIP